MPSAEIGCDGDGLTPQETCEACLLDAAAVCQSLVSEIVGEIQGLLESAAEKSCACEVRIADEVTGLVDQGSRVGDRLTSVVISQADALLRQAAGTAGAIETLASGPPGPSVGDLPERPFDPVAPTGDEEPAGDEEPEEPTGDEEPEEELPSPSQPRIQIVSPGEVGLITQCRSDLYAAPQAAESLLRRWTAAWARNRGGLGPIGSEFTQLLRDAGLADIPFVGDQLTGIFSNLPAILQNSATNVVNAIGCGGAVGGALPLEILTGLLQTYVSPAFGELGLPVTYGRRSLCPTQFPSGPDAHEAYLANAISENIRNSWWQLNNLCPQPQEAVLEARRAKLSAGEILNLHLRGHLDEQEFTTRLRELGYLRQSDYQDIRRLGVFVPPYTDQVRFMVRDVFRGDIVEKFGLDELFEDAFSSEAEELASKLGIQRDTMQNLWRAHWSIPAPGQLFDMVHRLPFVDAAQVEAFNQQLSRAGSRQRVSLDDFRPDRVREDVTQALIQQDILPFWIPRLLSLTFRPLTRREIRQAAEAGVIERERIVDAYRELGVNQSNAEKLAELARTRLNNRADSLEPARKFEQGIIDRAEAKRRLRGFSVDEERIEQVLTDAERKQDNHDAVKLYKSLAIDRIEAKRRLAAHGIRDELISQWLDDVDAGRDRHPLVDRYREGLLSRPEVERRLGLQGIGEETARRMLQTVDDDLEADLQKFCARKLEERFLDAEFERDELERRLGAMGMAAHLVNWWVRRAECKRDAIGRTPPTSKIVSWFKQGFIQFPDFIFRLRRIGWGQEDANFIAREAVADLEEDRRREREKLLKAIEKDERAVDREREKRRKQSERQQRQREKALERARKANERREKRLLNAADRLRDTLETDVAAAVKLARQAVRIGREEFGLSADERIEVLETAVKRFDPENDPPFLARYRALAAAREGLDQSPLITPNGR